MKNSARTRQVSIAENTPKGNRLEFRILYGEDGLAGLNRHQENAINATGGFQTDHRPLKAGFTRHQKESKSRSGS